MNASSCGTRLSSAEKKGFEFTAPQFRIGMRIGPSWVMSFAEHEEAMKANALLATGLAGFSVAATAERDEAGCRVAESTVARLQGDMRVK